MQVYLEKTYPMGFRYIDNRGLARPSAMFDMMQDAATVHAEASHIGREDLQALWVLSRLHCQLARPITVHEEIQVRTWCAGVRGATWLRAFELRAGTELVGQALSSWVVLDPDNRRILRPAQIPAMRNYLEILPAECPAVPGKLACGALQAHHVHKVRYSDLDVNGHMNNVKIVDVVCDGLELDCRTGRFVSEIQVNYTAECMPGEELVLSVADSPEGLTYVFGTVEGQSRFEACARLSAYEQTGRDTP